MATNTIKSPHTTEDKIYKINGTIGCKDHYIIYFILDKVCKLFSIQDRSMRSMLLIFGNELSFDNINYYTTCAMCRTKVKKM